LRGLLLILLRYLRHWWSSSLEALLLWGLHVAERRWVLLTREASLLLLHLLRLKARWLRLHRIARELLL
jgi:hypothetical protein